MTKPNEKSYYMADRSIGEKIFMFISGTLLILLALSCIFPFIHVLAKSLSKETAILSGKVFLSPIGFHLDAYKRVITNPGMIQSMIFTIVLTLTGTTFNVVTTTMAAYALSKDDLPLRKFFWYFILITVFFSGGIIPTYITVIKTGLMDSMWALIIPTAISTYNLVIMRSFFRTIPVSLEESARIEGCNDMTILLRIVIPLSLPMLATITLFYAVGHWNEFRAAMFYIESINKYPLQLKLNTLIKEDAVMEMVEAGQTDAPKESLKAASVIYATAPILIVYPFVQKYFVKGVLIGSVKG